MTRLVRDIYDAPVPVLGFGAAQHLTVNAGATRSAAFSAGVEVLMISSNADVYLKFGDNTVTASTSDHYLPAGVLITVSLRTASGNIATNLSVYCAGAATFHISELI